MAQKSTTPFLLILLLWGAGLGAAGQFAKISVIFPMIQDMYPDAGTALGFVVSLISFLGIIFGLFAGLILARLSFRKLLLSALVLGACISILQSYFPILPLMLFSRLVEGVSHLIIVVAAPTLIAQLSAPHHRNICMTLWSTFFGVTFAIVAWVGIPFAATYGASNLFIVHGIYMAAIAILLAAMLPKSSVTASSIPLNLGRILRMHVEIYRSPHKAAPALGWLFYTLTYVSLLTVLPDLLGQADRTLIATLLPLSGLLISLTLGMFLLRYFLAVHIVMTGFAIALVVVVFLIIFPDTSWLLVALLSALGLVQGPSFAAIPQLNSATEAQAHANGAVAQLGNLGNTLGTPIALMMLASFGLNGLFGFLILCYFSGFLSHYIQGIRRRV